MDTDELLKLPPEDRKAALRAKYGKPATPAKTYGPELPPPPSAVTRPPGAAPSPPPVVREVNLPTRGMNQTDLDQAALRAASAERSAALQQGQSVEKADERALRAREGAYTVGPGADMLGADTVARAIYGGRPVPNVVRVYGPRVEAMPMVEPTKAERDAAHRATVLKMDPIKMIMGEDAAPVDLPNEQDKKWARTAMANAGLSIAGGFFGGAVPLWELGSRVAGAMGADVSGVQLFPEAALSPGAAAEAAYDYGADRDVQRLARVALPPLAAMSELPDAMVGQPTRNPYKDAAETVTGVASRFGLGDAAGAVREATGIDEGETALFWDDVRPRADFDAAATEYLNGSRAAVDALPLRALPARLRTEAVDVDKWIEMAKIDPELATIAEVADLDLAVIETAVESLPIGLVMRYQPELRPPDSDLRKTIELRHERKRWRGNESFDAIGNIMAGGLVKPVKNGNDVLFVPSAWQHALRAAGAPWAATVVEADLHPYDMVFIPGVSRPDATAQDDQSWYAKWANLRLPSVYGVESAVRSGAFNDWLDVVGLNGGTRYADLASPESTWWGRTMADIAMPEYANRGYQDVFLRAGGDPNGVAADVLGAADVVMQFLLPVEEAVAAPFGAAMRGVNRGRMARRVGRELGVTSPGPAVAAMVPVLSGESDALNAVGHALNEETRDLIETGAMDPAKFTPRAKDEIRDVLRAARVENPDETTDLILGWLADRRARVRDTSSEVATLGGPETQKMRDSNAYKDRERDLEDMARDPANGLRPADIPIIMRELEVQALNAVDAGEIPSTEAYFQRHSWTTGIDEGADLPDAAPIFDDAAIAAMAPTDPAPRAEWQAGVDAARAAFAAKVKAGTDATTAMREVRAEAEAAFEARRVAAKAKDPASSMAREDDLALRGAVDAMSKPLVPKKAPLKSESPGTVHGSIERVVPRDENLAAFMANSVVKNADGTPMVLYHGTLSPEFETFQPLGPIEMGAHVGTAEQANVRITDKARLAEQGWIPEGDGRVMPVYVNITNPLRVPDSGFDPESILANAMNSRYGEQAARIEAAGGRDMLAALEKLPQEQRARTLRGFLERLGYDGLVYENAAEGAGDSFAAFRPEQIKSATANVGTYDPTNPSILYSRTGGADPIERVGEVPDHRIDRIAAMAPVDPASRAEWQAGVDAARAAFSAKVRAGADPIAALREVRAEAEAASDARRAAAKAKDPASSVAREDDFTLRGALDAMSKGKKTEEPNVSVISGSGPDDAATRAGDARVEEYREATRARMAMAVRNEARLEGVSSARDALDALIAGGDLTADELAVAKRIRGSILPEIRLVLMSPTDADLPNVPAGALGYFGPPWKGDPNGTVYLRRVANRDHGMDPDTILHEMLHAATSSRLRVGSLPKHEGTHLARAVADLQELRTHVLREVDARNVYINPHGLSNVGEFISAGLTEPMFQEVLRALPSPTTKGTLWSDFVSYIRRLLGIPKAEESALSALMARTDRLLDAPFDTTRPTNPSILRSAEGGVTRGSISPGTPDTVNVPNPDYAAWEARVNALSAEVDALKAVPADVPNPALAEWEAKSKATAAEVDELRASSNREMADLQARRESLQKNPRADDPDWEAEVEEVNDRIGEITRTTSVNPTLAAKEAELAAMRANPPAATLPTDPDGVVAAKAEALARLRRFKIPKEVPKPSDVSRWLIKLFRTGDVRTALHEGAHLMTLMRPKFEAEAARIFDSVDGKLTTKGHEQLADAVTRLLRGRYRPGSKADNIAQDVLDALGDVWARVRTLPIVDAVPDRLRAKFDTLPDAIPAEFRVMWDRELHPKAAADGVAVRLTDERQPRRFPFAVNASADAAENIAEQKAARAGKARAYGSIERDPTQVQAALGITPGMKDVDPVDLMANVIAYIGVERLRREWGAVGELKTLPSNKTAVPAERHASVLKRAKSRRDGYFMGAEPAPIQGTNDLALDANAQAGLRRLIREVEVSPLGGNVPEAFRDPNADLSRVSMDDYNRLVAEQIDLYAGYGAWREKNAALAAVPGVVRLLNNAEAWGDRGTARVVLDKVREAFVVNTLPDQMLQPFQRDVITAFERTVPEAITEVQRALLDQARKNKKGDLSFTSADLVVGLAKSMGPEVVPTDTLDVLRAAEVVLSEPDLNMLVGNASVLDELFARAPLGEGAATQMRNEVDALGFLDYVVRNAETDGTAPADWLIANRANLPEHLQAATPDDANLILADQMSVVLDGVQRRSLAVDNTGHEIALMFAGSDDETLAKKIPNDGVRRRLFRDVYEQWYSGDHTTIFDTLTDAGYVVSGPDYDQGAAVLGTILRLNIRRKVATLAARLAEAGLTGDVANLTQAGFKYDRPFSAVAVRSPRDRFRSDVVDFITAQLGWQTQAVRRDGAYKAPLGDITSMGTSAFSPEGKAAYAEAMAQIAKWGFTPGSNVVKWNQVDLGGGQRVILPDIFESAITDLVNEGAPTFMARPGAKMDARVGPVTEGAAWARTIDQEAVSVAAQLLVKTYGYSVGMLHKGMLTGLGPAIRAGYYVGNAFGGVLQLYQRMGVIGATRVLAGSAADGSMVANVMRRLHDSGAYVDEPARTGRLLPDGRYITDQMLARDAARYGLNTSQAKTEWSTTLINEIRAEEPSTWNRVVKAGLADVPGARTAARAADVALDFPRRWRRWLDEGATAIDNYYRVSTYLDGLKRGLAADEAAQVARDVAFDWNALTKFEKNVARKIILFYSFQRRNQDLFWWTFLHHPSRVTGQLRLMYGMQEANLGEDSELYVSPFNEGRIILDARPPFKDNHVALAQQGAMTMTPSTNVNAAMGLWLDLMGVATFDPVAGESLMNRLNPFIAAPLALTVGYDVRRNRKIEDTSMAVPPGVADLDYAISSRIVDLDNAMNGGLLMQALDARPVPPRDDATLDYPGQIRFEVNRENPGAVRLFWGMMNLLPVASVERNVATMSRATGAGGYEPKAGTDAVEEAGRWLGVPTESIPTRAKVVGDLRERATADTEALEREAEKGSVTSGRGR